MIGALHDAARDVVAWHDLYRKTHGRVTEIDRLAEALESAGWRPIATYPREHVPLGTLDPRDYVDWGPNALLFVPTGAVAPASDYRIVTGRLEADMWLGYGDDDSMFDIGVPSHWMPLPGAPDTTDRSEPC